ncbi:hypothetical protein E6W36_07190 [Hankyongella ginsenosidimutans]|uniref:Antitoxin n=1 Tax=Hankyongella ginsenosidimutans TaxID=1763828 RepID=A0A4D7CBD6_9SPHN|nr:type II toxin-antitoxin system Phd/YefM family antitoxin [Hankyongella ginsenosidimutans]QCI79406.1 hypothetical protein E6W36_07190 [Hankyongella ginsenosidimutans]TXG81543.1 MAG: hypothetical protein E6R12_13965 [Sphingomonadales bacterium]
MAVFTVHEAKTHLSRLIQQALNGEDVVIARGSKPVVRLTAVTDAFFEPLPDDELRHWDNG